MIRNNLKIATLLILSIIFIAGCKTSNDISKNEEFTLLKNNIDSVNYVFTPSSAMPIGGPSINLPSNYSLKIKKDTIVADLPYFGRSYSATIGNSDVGIKFTSTDFKYESSFNGSKDKWNIKIKTNDTGGRIELNLAVNSSGYATLSIYDSNRQPIIFYGVIN